MGRPEANRERIGDMLVASGLISNSQLGEALIAQRTSGLPLGKQLVALGYVGEAQLIQVLSNQLSVPWVSIERVDFSADLLARLPSDLADHHSVMPVYVRNVRGRGETLFVAMDDPTDDVALAAIANATGFHVRAMIASPRELRTAIEERYFGAKPVSRPPASARAPASFGEERTGQLPKPGPSPRVAPPAPVEERPAKRPPPPPKVPTARHDGSVPVDQYAAPSRPPAADSSRTLTLLDGTRIHLPSGKKTGSAQTIGNVRHVVKAVSAASADLGTGGPLRWHDIVQALIDAASARGVTLTRKEVADAWLAKKGSEKKPADP